MIKRWNLLKLWKRKAQILEGYFNRHLNFWKKDDIESISQKRLAICRSNKCGFYDPDGSSEAAFLKGKESCGGCGCVLVEKTSCMSCSCYLEELNEKPLWKAVKDVE